MKPIKFIRQKFAISFATAVLAVTATWWHLDSRERRLAESTRMTTVLKAKKFVAGGTSVSPEMVDEMPVPEGFVSANTLRHKTDLLDAQARPRFKARVGFAKGELLSTSLLAEPSTFGGLAWTMEPGQMAISCRLSPEDAVGGLVQPGDFVRVYSAIGGIGAVALPRIRVVAVGDRLWDMTRVAASIENSKGMAVEPVLITLMGTPEEALVLHRILVKGGLRLALISPLADMSARGE